MSTYICDELISSRITIINNKINVNYYSLTDIDIPWYKKFFVDKCEIVNKKNKELYYEASDIAKEKKLPPIFPPTKFMIN